VNGSPQHSYDLKGLLEMIQHLLTCPSREEFWETLVTLLGKQAGACVSLWRKRGKTYLQLRPSPLEFILVRSNIVERVFDTGTLSSISHYSADGSRGELLVASEIALPIFEGEALVAVLKLERTSSFEEEEREILQCLASAVSSLLVCKFAGN
jgi:hypothetical protein